MTKEKQSDQPKKKRGRPRKEVGLEAPKEPEKPVYSHESKKRCTGPASRSHPAWCGPRCGTLLKPNGTLHGGKVKRWICPKCDKTFRTEGKQV